MDIGNDRTLRIGRKARNEKKHRTGIGIRKDGLKQIKRKSERVVINNKEQTHAISRTT